MAFDDPENPVAMDALLAACGATVLDYPFKTECCGAAFAMPRLDVMQRLSARLVDMAAEIGADCIAVACPLCQMNLDLRRGQTNRAAGRPHALPVPYFTQLLGLALGLSEADLALDKLVLPFAPALEAAASREAQRAAEAAGKAAPRAARNDAPAPKPGARSCSQPGKQETTPCA